ncbi:MAG: MarR family EPS-associated transcriptional regulator [Lentisphaerae bacterium]|nr:MarR family EPS-associated transcriptional regulator [Lentisphaerota bacterium]
MPATLAARLEKEETLHIIREIDRSPEMSQRELSIRLGISVGKVNFLINALIDKGFIKVENFRKSNNKIAYLYNLTPCGIEEKARMTYLFLKRKTAEYEQLAQEIRQLQAEVQLNGAPAGEQNQ